MGPKSNGWCPYKKRIQRETQRKASEDRGRHWRDAAPGGPGALEAGRSKETFSSPALGESMAHTDSLISGF